MFVSTHFKKHKLVAIRSSLVSCFSIALILVRSFLFHRKKIVLVVLTEHLGDIVACEPLISNVKAKFPNRHIVWLVNAKYQELVRWNPEIYSSVPVSCFGVWALLSRLAYRFFPVVDLHIHCRECFFCGLTQFKRSYDENITLSNYYLHGSLAEAFSKETLLGSPLRRQPVIYLGPRIPEVSNLPDKYIVIHPFSNEESRSWSRHQAAKFSQSFKVLPIVRIGVANDPVPEDSEIDLRGSLSISQLIYVISKAEFFVGVDSGPAHIANAVKKRATLLFAPYREFTNYFPYTGFFENSQNVDLIFQKDGLSNLCGELVAKRVANRII